MWTATVLWLYGSLLIVGGFLAVFWGQFARKRLHSIEHAWYRDRYFILATGFAIWTSGQVILNIGRLVGNLTHGLSAIMLRPEGLVIAGGLLLVLGGSFLFVWLADLERHPPRWHYLRAMGIATALWMVIAGALSDYVPARSRLPDWLQAIV